MEDVYKRQVYVELYQSASEIYLENLYEWLGKHVYRIGCERFKKRKEREASFLEMEDEEMHPKRREHLDEKADAVGKTLEYLPDLYQATLFAFYYDYLKIDEIAQLMDCSPDVIMNRLNYTRKYFKRAIENEQEENEGQMCIRDRACAVLYANRNPVHAAFKSKQVACIA